MNIFSASLRTVAVSVVLGALSFACAAPADGPAEPEQATAADLTAGLSDSALEGKLGGILQGVTFESESDFPYVVLEGDETTETKLTEALVRKSLRKAVKAGSSSHRDIQPASCRADSLNVEGAITDTSDDNSKKLGIALKVMRSQLDSVVGFEFGTNQDGDEDDVGPVVFLYAGISKTSGKVIAIMTEAVFT
jgi:hypothetical protein